MTENSPETGSAVLDQLQEKFAELIAQLMDAFKDFDLSGILSAMGIDVSEEDTEDSPEDGQDTDENMASLPEALASRLPEATNASMIAQLESHTEKLLTLAVCLEGNGGRSVALAMPKTLNLSKEFEFIYHFHGLHSQDPSHVTSSGQRRLDQTLSQLESSNRNAILIYPISDENTSGSNQDSDWMKPPEDNFEVMHQEVLGIMAENGISVPAGSKVTVEGHSAGGKALMNIAESGAASIDRYVFLDATYGSWGRNCVSALKNNGQNAQVQVAFIEGTETEEDARAMSAEGNVELYSMRGIRHGEAIDHFFGGVEVDSATQQALRVG